MLIETISFQLYSPIGNGYVNSEQFLVENTPENQELIWPQRHVREIEFGQMFDFQFSREKREPKFIQFGNAVLDAFDNDSDVQLEIDDIDEMTGMAELLS